MSVTFHFHCTKCDEYGGAMITGNSGWKYFEIIDSFKFIAYHIDSCGYEHIRVAHDADTDRDSNVMGRFRKDFLEKTKDLFPNSTDWWYASNLGFGIKRETHSPAMTLLNTNWTNDEMKQNAEILNNIDEDDGA